VEGGVLWRNGCDGKVLRCGAGERNQHQAGKFSRKAIEYTENREEAPSDLHLQYSIIPVSPRPTARGPWGWGMCSGRVCVLSLQHRKGKEAAIFPRCS
jgi:hypothetical protein